MPKFPLKILMLYPKYPDTFWGFKHALKFISKRAVHPPLGLLTVASLLPSEWQLKIVDLNIQKLEDKDLAWPDYVFISAMEVQRPSVYALIKILKSHHLKIVAGGPLFTASAEDFPEIDYLVLNEAEITLPLFLEDLKNNCPQHIYTTTEFPDITTTPSPVFDLVKMKKYVSMNIQYSRGCPFNCEFCDITTLFGRSVRTKTTPQILGELNNLYDSGWRGNVFFVDDNFIGNKNKLKAEVLPALIAWMQQKRYPFVFTTEASINLADDEVLMQMMVDAGFASVFVGIETPDLDSLTECHKLQNKNRDLVDSVQKIQSFGLEVTGGFIVGFDSDPVSIFESQIEFIKKSKIITAMVGLLNAPKNTQLYHRLKQENRLLQNFSGDNTDLSLNFIPKMDVTKLIEGYKKIIKDTYAINPYYSRVKSFLSTYRPPNKMRFHFGLLRYNFGYYAWSIFISMWIMGIRHRGRKNYWNLFFWSLFRHPRTFQLAITAAIYGHHFRTIFQV